MAILDKIFNKKQKEQEDEKSITLKDMMPGDIMVFDTDGSLIDDLITEFTGSKATHGALFVQNEKKAVIVDSGTTGVDLHLVSSNPSDNQSKEEPRIVHVRRHAKLGGIDEKYDNAIAPVIETAYDYVRQDLPYPYSDFVLLAMILVFKNVTDKNINQPVLIKLLRIIAAELKTLIDQKFHEGKHTMVCSSFVYQCFLDASKSSHNRKLKLKIKNGDLQAEKSKRSVTLFDLYVEHAAEYNYHTYYFSKANTEPVTETIEELLENLIDKDNANHIGLVKSNALSNAIEEFLRALMDVLGFSIDSVKDLIETAQKQQAMFVTPNDLYCHTTNTVSVGVIKLYRDGSEYKP